MERAASAALREGPLVDPKAAQDRRTSKRKRAWFAVCCYALRSVTAQRLADRSSTRSLLIEITENRCEGTRASHLSGLAGIPARA